MTDPFRIEGPAAISFSGGRTSAYMLYRILDAHDGVLPDDVHVLFANTGKEREETLEFVRECSERWAVRIHWLEYARHWFPSLCCGAYVKRPVTVEVDFKTASRKREPFSEVIRSRRFLPNPVTRFCTGELKIRAMNRWMSVQGYERFLKVVGLRADEPARVKSLVENPDTASEEAVCPLHAAGITKADVMRFWEGQPFDLKLRPWEGNCDLCFLKGQDKRRRVMTDRPDLAAWWIEREREMAASFRAHGPSYATLLRQTQRQPRLPLIDAEDSTDIGSCVCTD